MSVGGLRGLVSQACFNCHALSLLADMRTRGGMLWESGVDWGREGVGDLYMRGRRVESEERAGNTCRLPLGQHVHGCAPLSSSRRWQWVQFLLFDEGYRSDLGYPPK